MAVETAHRTEQHVHHAQRTAETTAASMTSADFSAMTVGEVREMTDVLFTRLRGLEEGTREYSYVRNTLVELNMGLVRHAASRSAQ
jgi:RNA polymerase sigma-B factor